MDVMEMRRRLMMGMAQQNGKSLELIGTYTVPTSWENDTDGNPPHIIRTVLQPYIGGNTFDLYYLDFINNNASNQNYKASCIVYGNAGNGFPVNAGFSNFGVCARNDYRTPKGLGEDISLWASSGTVIMIYKLIK